MGLSVFPERASRLCARVHAVLCGEHAVHINAAYSAARPLRGHEVRIILYCCKVEQHHVRRHALAYVAAVAQAYAVCACAGHFAHGLLQREQMQELDNAEEMEQDIQSSSSFEQKGTVYEDPETGKLYVVMPKSGN